MSVKPLNNAPAAFLRLVFLSLVLFVARCFGQPITNVSAIDTNAVHAEMETAMHQVEKIVNQPVPAYRRQPGMRVGVYSPGWFHEGAHKPDFEHADVRTTQETPYAKDQYVTSDLNPGLVFLGSQLEFNAATKFFYTNRSVPKKKLTESEMLEINRLYRIIGNCERQLRIVTLASDKASMAADNSDKGEPAQTTEPAKRARLLNPYIGGGAILGLVLLVIIARAARS